MAIKSRFNKQMPFVGTMAEYSVINMEAESRNVSMAQILREIIDERFGLKNSEFPPPVWIDDVPKHTYGRPPLTYDGQTYVTNGDGENITRGVKVRNSTKGYEGVIVRVESNGRYAQVAVGVGGQLHGLDVRTLSRIED